MLMSNLYFFRYCFVSIFNQDYSPNPFYERSQNCRTFAANLLDRHYVIKGALPITSRRLLIISIVYYVIGKKSTKYLERVVTNFYIMHGIVVRVGFVDFETALVLAFIHFFLLCLSYLAYSYHHIILFLALVIVGQLTTTHLQM